MTKRSFRRNCSGQVLVITSLLVALVLLSTCMYVSETGKGVPNAETNTDNVSIEYKIGIRNTIISALSNITNGGDIGILPSDLEELSSILNSYSYQNLIKIDFTPLDATPYHGGIWISEGTNGEGISSAYVDLTLTSQSLSTSCNLEYAENITSAINFTAQSSQIESQYQVNLTINVLNDGKPALAQNFSISMQSPTGWVPVEAPPVNSFGNGTYSISFTPQTDQISLPPTVFVNCEDQRGIVVGAIATCDDQ